MKIRYHFESLLQLLADTVFAVIPRPEPAVSTLLNCKIVSHRGEHDNKSVKENTLAAFDRVLNQGIWGIELDIRWTKDLHPVVIHDPDCRRVFASALKVNAVNLDELQSRVPDIPSLDQIIQRYGKKIHLMIEIKEKKLIDPEYQQARLKTLLSSLVPGDDFHILALSPDIFELVDFLPGRALLPVAEYNIHQLSKKALGDNYAGISGQYLLISGNTIRKHGRNDQKTGTGFVRSRYCFYRELNRGVEWIFTNHALKLHSFQQELLNQLNRR